MFTSVWSVLNNDSDKWIKNHKLRLVLLVHMTNNCLVNSSTDYCSWRKHSEHWILKTWAIWLNKLNFNTITTRKDWLTSRWFLLSNSVSLFSIKWSNNQNLRPQFHKGHSLSNYTNNNKIIKCLEWLFSCFSLTFGTYR